MFNIIDCTLRDGGYYNKWDFSPDLVSDYLYAMHCANIDFVELGFRSFDVSGFRGASAYTTDRYLEDISIPVGLKVGVMVNASELISHKFGDPIRAVKALFSKASDSPVKLVRFACHLQEYEASLGALSWLKSVGYQVGINLMQIAERTDDELINIANITSSHPIDILYFADSMGSLDTDRTISIIKALRKGWNGDLGIHAHDNMGRALANTVAALYEGVNWVDCTVTGMGRGPGNVQTEYLLLELGERLDRQFSLTPLLALIKKHFNEMKYKYGWGINPYYYLAGKYSIHPTYIQEMLSDPRFDESEILATIDKLKLNGGGKFNPKALNISQNNLYGDFSGDWRPEVDILGRDVLILGGGASLKAHRCAVERFISDRNPFVIALNFEKYVNPDLVDLRAVSHPLRLFSEISNYSKLVNKLVIPAGRLTDDLKKMLDGVNYLNFGHDIQEGLFEVFENRAITPNSLALGYALAIAVSGKAANVMLAGIDGYDHEDARNLEIVQLLDAYYRYSNATALLSLTPTQFSIKVRSVYSF